MGTRSRTCSYNRDIPEPVRFPTGELGNVTVINPPLNRKLRMALVGGGGAAFIGPVHVTAAALDRRAELVAGALSSDAAKARAAAEAFGIPAERAYGAYAELLDAESQRPADQRIDFVSIATPNRTHYSVARSALEHGFHVICDKPLTTRLDEAQHLARLVEHTGAVFAVTHSYAGYPAVREAREMLADGQLGEVQAFRVQYIQGGLRGHVPGRRPERGAWKSDPALAGPSGTLADIGTHAFHLARHVTGLLPVELACQMRTFFPGRALEDYAHVTLRCPGNALGTITVSQVTHGRLNDLVLEVDGSNGSLRWRQEDPERLVVRRFGQPVQIYERNPRVPVMHAASRALCRLPGGHPEGFLEAFANVYREAFDDMVARATGAPAERSLNYPTVRDGVEGVTFVERCLASDRYNGNWQPW